MIARLVLGMAMIVMAIALVPIISQQFRGAQEGLGMINDSSMTATASTMFTAIPYMFGLALGGIAIMVIIHALRSGGIISRSDRGVESDDEEDYDDEEEEEDEDEDEEDYDEDDEDEEEDDEPEPVKSKAHSTVVTTTKKTGERKINVKVGPGYNVDKYQIDKPADTKLTYKEDMFKKTKYD